MMHPRQTPSQAQAFRLLDHEPRLLVDLDILVKLTSLIRHLCVCRRLKGRMNAAFSTEQIPCLMCSHFLCISSRPNPSSAQMTHHLLACSIPRSQPRYVHINWKSTKCTTSSLIDNLFHHYSSHVKCHCSMLVDARGRVPPLRLQRGAI